MRVIGVIVRVEHGIERICAHAQELLAQVRRAVDQDRGMPALAELLDQQAATTTPVLGVSGIAGAPHGADARHAAGGAAAEDRGAEAHAAAVPWACGTADLAKQPEEIRRRRRRDLLDGNPLDLGQRLGGLHHVGRLIGLAAIGLGREERRVCLHQQAVERHGPRRCRASASDFLNVTTPVKET